MKTKENELQEVERRIKLEKSRRMFERYQTIRLHLKGKDNKQIAEVIGRTEETIRTYIRSYQKQGLDGLERKLPPGPAERLSQEQQEQLKQTIIQFLPHEVGFIAKHNWTLQLMRDYIKREFGESYSLRGISKMMHRLDLSYTKPTYTLDTADEAKQQVFVETTFPALKKIPQ